MKKRLKRFFKRLFQFCFSILILGFLLPQKLIIPVEGATPKDWNVKTFWYYPWGTSITHKGVDIFAKEGKGIYAATGGPVIYRGNGVKGGNFVVILGPKWRYHYYAHLKEVNVKLGEWTSQGDKIGTVGSTGNAKNKPPHLHYTLGTFIPYPWRIDEDRQGWMKMFILNPLDYLPVQK